MSAGTRSRSASGCSCEPHVEEGRLDVGAFLDRLDRLLRLAVRRLVLDGTGERARVGLGVVGEERHGQVLGLRLRRVGIGLDPLGDFRRVRLLPVGHVRGIQLVGLDPVLGDGRMQGRPLGHDPRLSAELVLLEPAFDVGTDRLALLGAAPVLHDGAKLACHAVAEQSSCWPPSWRRPRRRRCRRRPKDGAGSIRRR